MTIYVQSHFEMSVVLCCFPQSHIYSNGFEGGKKKKNRKKTFIHIYILNLRKREEKSMTIKRTIDILIL